MRTSPGSVVLRNGIDIADPVEVALGFLGAYPSYEGTPTPGASLRESDLRRANRGGARISAPQIAAILERRLSIERALRSIDPAASLARTSVPWSPLTRLFESFADIRGVGFSKMTKALHPKRPALIPILDSVVHAYLEDDDPGVTAPFGERALALVRGYKRDLDRNGAALRAIRKEIAGRGYSLTEVRLLDILIWSVASAN